MDGGRRGRRNDCGTGWTKGKGVGLGLRGKMDDGEKTRGGFLLSGLIAREGLCARSCTEKRGEAARGLSGGGEAEVGRRRGRGEGAEQPLDLPPFCGRTGEKKRR